MAGRSGFFDLDERCAALGESGERLKAGRRLMIHVRKPKGQPMSGPRPLEGPLKGQHVLAEQTARMGLFIRTGSLARAGENRNGQPCLQHAPPALA
jgi:hypothetical protein